MDYAAGNSVSQKR